MTTTTKHTPGPWSTDGDHIFGPVYLLADIVSADTIEEAEANARLIAAAPDLLAALEHCCAVMADCVMFPERDDENRAYSQARAAISKATGDA